ncbi:MAG TPA: hypothetical protein VGJ18_15975 [Gemmatimonadaceae bacterium]|jgi:hypothetical protein
MNESRVNIDYPAALGLCVFAFTHFVVLDVIGYLVLRLRESGLGEEQLAANFSVYLVIIIGASLVALGSHAAALAWTRQRLRRIAPVTLLTLEGAIAVMSACLTALTAPNTRHLWAPLAVVILGPANVTLVTYTIVNRMRAGR